MKEISSACTVVDPSTDQEPPEKTNLFSCALRAGGAKGKLSPARVFAQQKLSQPLLSVCVWGGVSPNEMVVLSQSARPIAVRFDGAVHGLRECPVVRASDGAATPVTPPVTPPGTPPATPPPPAVTPTREYSYRGRYYHSNQKAVYAHKVTSTM